MIIIQQLYLTTINARLHAKLQDSHLHGAEALTPKNRCEKIPLAQHVIIQTELTKQPGSIIVSCGLHATELGIA